MAMTRCKTCGVEVAVNSKTCPKCGAGNPGVKAVDMVFLVVVVVVLSLALAQCSSDDEPSTPDTIQAEVQPDRKIRPEMLITFEHGTVACLSKEELAEITAHAVKGETTKANAMPGCTMIPPGQRVKTLSAEYNTDADIGIVEIVGEGADSSEGAWAFTIGAVQVK